MSKYQNTARNAEYERILAAAMTAGYVAGRSATVTPMVVIYAGGTKREIVEDGVCGFAYVTIKPATHSFVRWMLKNGNGHKAYYGGWEMSVPGFGQSMTRKSAAAAAMARVLADNGIPASFYDRMD